MVQNRILQIQENQIVIINQKQKTMKKSMTTFAIFLLATIIFAQERVITFTPHEGVPARIWNGEIYTQWDHRQNKDGIKESISFIEWARQLPKAAKLGKKLYPAQTIHFTEVNRVAVAEKNMPGLHYILSRSWNQKMGIKASKMVYISEDATAIAAQIEAWYNGDSFAPVILSTKRGKQWNVGETITIHVWANEGFTIELPAWLEFGQQ